jgi:hypothetical protein
METRYSFRRATSLPMGAESGRTHPTMGKNAAKRRARTIRMVVIPKPEPGTRSVIDRIGEGTVVFTGTLTTTTMACGKCGAPLIRGMRVDQIQHIVLRCNACGAYNESLVS